MRKILLWCALGWAGAVVAAERGPALPDYPASRVAANTYVIHGPVGYPSPHNQGFMNNPAFVITSDGVVVIDPGSSVQSGEMTLRQIRKVTDKKVVAVLNTHVHGDHWLGNQAFRETDASVAIYGHPHMIADIAIGVGDNWVANMEQLTEGATRGTRVEGPNIAIGHGDHVTFGGIDFRFHHYGTAHSKSDVMIEVPSEQVLFLADNANNRPKSDVMIEVPSEQVLFLADNANNRRIVRMDDGTFTGNAATLDTAMKIKAKVYVPGHGQTGKVQFVHDYRDYLVSLKQAVKKYYDQGMSDFEMKPKVAVELARFKKWPGFEEELGKHISLAYLEVESESF